MNIFETKVSDAEYSTAPELTAQDLAVMAYAMSVGLTGGVPISKILESVAKITPNARLRRFLMEVWSKTREGEFMTKTFSSCPDIKDPVLLECVEVGEKQSNLNNALFAYAILRGYNPGQLAEQIGVSEAVKKFTEYINMFLGLEMPLIKTIKMLSNDLLKLSLGAPNNEELSFSKSLREHPEFFDPLFVEIVEAGEGSDNLYRSFVILSDQ
jgi:type II secretory pathway component PulF